LRTSGGKTKIPQPEKINTNMALVVSLDNKKGKKKKIIKSQERGGVEVVGLV